MSLYTTECGSEDLTVFHNRIEPSSRNKAANAACVAPYQPVNPDECANAKTWDANKPVLCTGRDGT